MLLWSHAMSLSALRGSDGSTPSWNGTPEHVCRNTPLHGARARRPLAEEVQVGSGARLGAGGRGSGAGVSRPRRVRRRDA